MRPTARSLSAAAALAFAAALLLPGCRDRDGGGTWSDGWVRVVAVNRTDHTIYVGNVRLERHDEFELERRHSASGGTSSVTIYRPSDEPRVRVEYRVRDVPGGFFDVWTAELRVTERAPDDFDVVSSDTSVLEVVSIHRY